MFKTLIPAAICSVFMAVAAQAATVQHNNVASFNASAGPTDLNDLNAAALGSLTGATLNIGDLTLDGTATNGINQISDASAFDIDGTRHIRGIGGSGSVFSMIFNNPIFAFGVDLFGVNNGEERTQIIINGTSYSMPVVQNSQASFFGLTSDMAFTRVDFLVLDGGEDAGIDNIRYGGTGVVPLPASLPLMLAALGVVGLLRRRSKAA